jgi:hypothetical protein
MAAALRAIGRIARNLGDNLADIPFTEIPLYWLYWIGRAVARVFTSGSRDISDAFAILLGVIFLGLCAIIVTGLIVWYREASSGGASTTANDPGSQRNTSDRPWWEQQAP